MSHFNSVPYPPSIAPIPGATDAKAPPPNYAQSSTGKQAERFHIAKPEVNKALPCRFCWGFHTDDEKKLSQHMHFCLGLGGGVRASEVIKTGFSADPFEDWEVTKARLKQKKLAKKKDQATKHAKKLRPSKSMEY